MTECTRGFTYGHSIDWTNKDDKFSAFPLQTK